MNVLSLLQPWASLVVLGHKKIETRSWNTKYRGELLIHASAKKVSPKMELTDAFAANYGKLQLFDGIPSMFDLPLGAIIGKAILIDVVTSEWFYQFASNGISNIEQEQAFGDYSPNRFLWILHNPVLFKEPIPCKGQLGIWNFDVEHEIKRQEMVSNLDNVELLKQIN